MSFEQFINEVINDAWHLPNIKHEFTIDLNEPPEWVKSFAPVFSTTPEISFEFECGCNEKFVGRILGYDPGLGPDATCTVICTGPYEIHIKRHKKKRINKKWNKRYGEKTITKFKKYELSDVRVEQNGSHLDFIGQDIRYIL